ncbi:MAG TPA: type III pantothenate kinase [Polyangiaceae bacterium]|nr:type III pantothenate kinase [Polyangiaceae bacterium]
MLLAVDVGNTHVTCGLFAGSALVHTFRLRSLRERTADECAVLFHQMLALRGVARQEVSAAIVASVVPSLTDTVTRAIDGTLTREPLVVGAPGFDMTLAISCDSPAEVGADRIVNAVAAHARCPGGALVVDLGTATTIDCVSPRAEFLGGVIAPGVEVSLQALVGRAAKLPAVPLAAPPTALGRNTRHAMQAGSIYGHAALVDGLLSRVQAELEFEAEVIGTGGLAALIAPYTARVRTLEPDLTLMGLRLLFEKNRGKG